MSQFKFSVVAVLCLALVNLGSPLVAEAQIVSTLQAVDAQGRAANLATIESQLSRDAVRQQFESLGVDPAAIDARIASMTDSELQSLAQHLQDQPAGGDALAIIGIVFLVLLILELVGVIDIFKRNP